MVVELEYELFEFIGNLKLDLQILECSNAAYTTKETCELGLEEWRAVNSFNVFDGSPIDGYSIPSLIIENFYNANINDSDDYLSRFSIHAEIIDLAGGDESLFEDYHDDSDNVFTISKPESTTEFETGWHLLSPPLADNHILDNIFANPAYDCADGCDGTAAEDCAGVCEGSAVEDNCGTCDSDSSNDCVQDCAGVWGGTAVEDAIGECGGNAVVDNCGRCDNDATNDCDADCNGDFDGDAVGD